jgi:hypothetical protein
MSENEMNVLMRKIEELPVGHTRFIELSDGKQIAIKKLA